MIQADILVIGSGIGGLRAALECARNGAHVALVTKRALTDSNTLYAQGGISAVPLVDNKPLSGDSFEDHIRDTHVAGAGVCNEDTVSYFVKNAFTHVIEPLIAEGVTFTQSSGTYPYSLHQEGGHSAPRIFHVADFTGRAVEETLAKHAQKSKNITIYENHVAIDLITQRRIEKRDSGDDYCCGAYVLDEKLGKVIAFSARATILATGGAGRVYLYTSNPDTATGDGIAMAYRRGIGVQNMEFIQFHPTTLYNPNPKSMDDRRFLITEALRGKNVGGILTLTKEDTTDFVKALGYHKDGSAATRDVVARAIDMEMKKCGLDHVYLNVTPAVTGKSAEYLKEGFPDIYAHCKSIGIDLTKEPIPIVPGTHYTCGGIVVDADGQTTIPGLYAVGECACTGLHGGNRLASNSLSEAALYGKRAIAHALEHARKEIPKVPEWSIGKAILSKDEVQVSHHWDEVRRIMWNLVGIARSEERLQMALRRIALIREEVHKYYWRYIITPNFLELRNITLVAEIIIRSALQRKESRGAHFRIDFPDQNKAYEKVYTLHKEESL